MYGFIRFKLNSNHHAGLALFSLLLMITLIFFPDGKIFAGPESKQSLLEKLKSIQGFQSNYRQINYSENGEVIQEANGKFILDKNRSFRNDILVPEKSTMVSDGTRLWLVDYELEQVSITSLESYLDDSPLILLLDKSSDALEPYEVTLLSEKDSHRIYRLRAINQYDSIRELRVAFRANRLNFIELDEQRGRRIRIEFSAIQALEDKAFFPPTYPDSFDVVDETVAGSKSEDN